MSVSRLARAVAGWAPARCYDRRVRLRAPALAGAVFALTPVSAGLVVGSGCSLIAAEGEGEGEGEGEAVVIDAVDGDGSLAGIVAGDVVVPGDGIAGAHRIRDVIVVSGDGLELVDTASIEQDGTRISAEVLPMTTPRRRAIRLPAGIAPGLLTLVLSAGATEVRSQVFVLQGEPGAPGLSSLIRTRDASSAECAFSGLAIDSGFDDNGDGVLDDVEVTSTSTRCENAITAPRTITVSDEAGLQAALSSLSTLSLQALVTIALPPSMSLSGLVTVSHRDSRFISINGAPSTITSTSAESFRILSGGVIIRDVNLIRGGAAGSSVGINIAGVGSDATLIDVSVTGFNEGVGVTSGSATLVDVSAVNNVKRGIRVEGGARVRSQGRLSFTGSEVAVTVSRGATFSLQNAAIEGSVLAASVTDGATFEVFGIDAVGTINTRGGHVVINSSIVDTVIVLEGASAIVGTSQTDVGMTASQGGHIHVGVAVEDNPIALTARTGGIITFDASHTCTANDAFSQCIQTQ